MINWFHFAAVSRFYPLAGRLIPWFYGAAALLGALGLYLGLWLAPTDAQQGEAYRIIFVHVPAAWMSMVVYLAMAFWAGIGLVFNARLASVLALALAEGELVSIQVFALARIDEDYQASKWGRDHESEVRATSLARELDKAAEFIAAARQESNK